jgi:hypothetical protein
MAPALRQRLLDRLWPPPPDELEELVQHDPVAVYRWAQRRGWTAGQAGAWAAWIVGLPITDGAHPMAPWRLSEVLALAFMRQTVDRWR